MRSAKGKRNLAGRSILPLSRWVAGAVILTALAAPALAAPDVGLVTGLAGEVIYWNQAEKQSPAKAQAFLKIRQGDRVKLPEGAMVQLLYFAGGRQETWKGPVTVKVGEAESQAAGKQPTSPPEVKLLSSKVAKRMSGAPMIVARHDLRTSGGSQVMREQTQATGVIPTMGAKQVCSAPPPTKPLSDQERQEVAEAEKIYRDLRHKANAEDLTPEIYLITVYADYGQYDKMAQFIDTLLAKKPGDPNLKKLKAWAQSKS